METPEIVLCTYRVVPGEEAAFEALLAKHWPTLRAQGLVTERRPQAYRGAGPTYHELFEWKDGRAPEVAHQSPEVMAIWEPMGALCEARDGRPAMEFPHVEPVALP